MMNWKILILSLIVPLSLYGQTQNDCSDILEKDKFSKKDVFRLKEKLILDSKNENALVIDVSTGRENATRISISEIDGIGCVNRFHKAYFLFRSGETMDIKNDGSNNCDAEIILLFGGDLYLSGGYGKEEEYRKLMTEEVETIRIRITRGRYYEQDLTSEQSVILKKSLACLNPFDK